VLRGLLNYGFFDEADDLLKRWVRHTDFCMADKSTPEGPRMPSAPDVRIIVPENWNPETGDVVGSGGLTWGGLWLPAVVMRNFWPLSERSAILRPGGYLQLVWGNRWNVNINQDRARINGRSFRLASRTSYLLDESAGELRPLEPGKADPVVLSRLGLQE
jgi:hypothetical protein